MASYLAVDETMRAMESEMQCKVRKGGVHEDRRTGEMLYSKFFHRDSRPINGLSDPHWHVHCFLHNATFDPVEKRWKAGQFRGLIADKGYFQECFHTLLAQRLSVPQILWLAKHARENNSRVLLAGEWRGMILLGYDTGIRLSDAANFTWANVDLLKRILVFRARKTAGQAKGGKKDSVVYMHLDLVTYFESLPGSDDPNAPIFPSLYRKSPGSHGGLT
jgi:TrwC relaxase